LGDSLGVHHLLGVASFAVFAVFTFAGEVVSRLVESGLVEQRYAAVREVLVDGVTVTEVARR
jgi:hypothetical protein